MSALQASIVLVGDCYPDLTLGAITSRRFAPQLGLLRGLYPVASAPGTDLILPGFMLPCAPRTGFKNS